MKRIKILSICLLFIIFASSAFADQVVDRFSLMDIVNVKELGARGNGTSDDSVAFIAACARAINKIMYVPPGTYKLSNNVTAGSSVEVWFSNGVTLSVDDAKTFTISGKLSSIYIPTNSGAGTFTYSSAIPSPVFATPTVDNIICDATPDTDHTVTGATIVAMTAHENVAFGDLCYINTDGECAIVDADAEATCRAYFMAIASINADATGQFAFIPKGFIARDDTWSWSTVGARLYASTAGTTGNTWTETAPNGTGDSIVSLAVVLSATTIAVGDLTILVHN